MSLPDLAAVLWRQRELLERLAYRMVCEQMIMVSGRTSWFSLASDDVHATMSELSAVDMQRSLLADQVAAEFDLPAGCSLEDIAACAQPPWTSVLLEHRDAMIELSTQLRDIAAAHQKLVEQGSAAIDAALASVMAPQESPDSAGAISAYDHKGRASSSAAGNAMANWAQGLSADL